MCTAGVLYCATYCTVVSRVRIPTRRKKGEGTYVLCERARLAGDDDIIVTIPRARVRARRRAKTGRLQSTCAQNSRLQETGRETYDVGELRLVLSLLPVILE